MIKLGHRGYSDKYPENTMMAFKAAINGNFDGVETDVQLTKDNQLVLIHDETINRTSNGRGYVKDHTYQELCKFNFNYRFKNKIQYPNIEQMTYDLVKEKGMLKQVMFSSFHLDSLLKLRSIDPDLYLGYLFEDDYQKNKELVLKHHFHCHSKYVFLNEQEIKDYLKHHLDVNTWTVNDEEIKDFLLEAGVKTIITNKDI